MARGHALSGATGDGEHWFGRLGHPLTAEDERLAHVYLDALGISAGVKVGAVNDPVQAERLIRDPEWDDRWWRIEEHERQRLRTLAEGSLGRVALLEQLTAATLPHHDLIRAAAAHAFGANGALAGAAAGACALALHEQALARLAGAGDTHVFMRKCALFAAGRWPLGVVHQTFYLS